MCNAVYTKLWENEELKPIPNSKIQVNNIPSGNYLCIATDTFKDNVTTIYKKLKEYVNQNNLNTIGNVYQIYLPINYDSINPAHFLTEIKIRII